MKKLLIMLLLLVITIPSYAQKREWFDSGYDFTKVKSIAFALKKDDRYSDLVLNEMKDIYYQQIKSGIYDKLNTKCKIVSNQRLREEFLCDKGISEDEINALYNKDPDKVENLFADYISNNYDLYVLGIPIVYDMGTQYREGYVYTMPSVNTSLITFPNGQMATVSSNGQTVHTVRGGNFPTVYVSFRFDIVDAKTFNSEGKAIWVRLDDRARVNQDVLQNSKPKDVFKRIMSSFAEDFVDVINTKKASKSKTDNYGF